MNAGLLWKVPDEDPRSTEQDICFVPGADPYIFVATIVLPVRPAVSAHRKAGS